MYQNLLFMMNYRFYFYRPFLFFALFISLSCYLSSNYFNFSFSYFFFSYHQSFFQVFIFTLIFLTMYPNLQAHPSFISLLSKLSFLLFFVFQPFSLFELLFNSIIIIHSRLHLVLSKRLPNHFSIYLLQELLLELKIIPTFLFFVS